MELTRRHCGLTSLCGCTIQRDEPTGTDAAGRTYWAIEDAPSVLEGTVWVCRSVAAASTDVLESGGWETVSDDLASLQSLVMWLSLSCETADLQLWQRVTGGVLKSLERRSKKQQQSAMRLARMPHLLLAGGLPGLGSHVDDDGFGVRRSTRNRRTVTYRVESEEEEEDDEQEEEEGDASENASGNASDNDDDIEDEDDNSGGGSAEDRPRKPTRKQAKRKPEAEPERRSARLRRSGGRDGSGNRVRACVCVCALLLCLFSVFVCPASDPTESDVMPATLPVVVVVVASSAQSSRRHAPNARRFEQRQRQQQQQQQQRG